MRQKFLLKKSLKNGCFYLFFCFLPFLVDAQTTEGKEFWVTFGKNWREGTSIDDPFENTTLVVPRIMIVTKDMPTTYTITFTNQNPPIAPISNTIPARTVHEVVLNPQQKAASYIKSMGISSSSIHITTDEFVSVYAMNQCNKSADATNLLPASVLDKEYYQISYRPQGTAFDSEINKDAYAVIATENGTVVSHNSQTVATLNKGQVYYRTDVNDMTGAKITSNKPVAFFAMNQGTYIDHSTSRDCLFQQLAPVNTWGRNFFVPVTDIANIRKNRVRILASMDFTKVKITGGIPIKAPDVQFGPVYNYTINAGDFIEFEVRYTDMGCFIEADAPVGVCTYLTTPASTEYFSDPAQAWLPAIEQLTNEGLVSPFIPASGTSLENFHAVIITPTETKNNTRVSIGTQASVPLFGGHWVDNVASDMSYFNMALTNPTESYFFTNSKGFIIMGYGIGSAESYYCLAFSAMRNLAASFYANNIHNQNLPNHLFCVNDVTFRAEIDAYGIEIDSIKWYIDGTEYLPAQNKEIWEKTFPAGNYEIQLEVFTDDESIKTIKSSLHIGAKITITRDIENGGTTTGEGCYKVGNMISVTATPFKEFLFTGWSENGTLVHENNIYTFNVQEDRDLIAHFIHNLCTVSITVNNPDYGSATGSGVFPAYSNVRIEALVNDCYRFSHWLVNNKDVIKSNLYIFTITEDIHFIANFYDLDFDTYAPTLWDNTFMLNLRKLREDGYEVTGCKWFKNGIEERDTRTINEFSYSAGFYERDLLELAPTVYMFRLETANFGPLCSSPKTIEQYMFAHKTLVAYPNPVQSGGRIIIEGFSKGSPLFIYNQYGACVGQTTAAEHSTSLTLEYPPGIYLIRCHNKGVKVIIMK